MDMLSSKQKLFLYLGIGGVILIAIFYYIHTISNMGEDNETLNTYIEQNTTTEERIEENTIIIHITGAVNNPGIVKVNENARINDVIERAGGLLENADVENVNLAYVVEDGQKIYIPFKGEEDKNSDDGEIVQEGAGENVLQEETNEKSGGLININNATKEKLEELPGIGSSTASKIIVYREENGKFKSIEDIKNVSGIGTSKYEQIKSHICV